MWNAFGENSPKLTKTRLASFVLLAVEIPSGNDQEQLELPN
jgi:hypothetical protein